MSLISVLTPETKNSLQLANNYCAKKHSGSAHYCQGQTYHASTGGGIDLARIRVGGIGGSRRLGGGE